MENYQGIIEDLMARCRQEDSCRLSAEETENQAISEAVESGMKLLRPAEFIEWVRNHRIYSFCLYEAQQRGVCAKPGELAALVLEMILREEVGEPDH